MCPAGCCPFDHSPWRVDITKSWLGYELHAQGHGMESMAVPFRFTLRSARRRAVRWLAALTRDVTQPIETVIANAAE